MSVCHEMGRTAHMSEFLPTVVLDVTHIDKIIGDIEEAKDAIITQLAGELKGKPYAKHLIGNCDAKGSLRFMRGFTAAHKQPYFNSIKCKCVPHLLHHGFKQGIYM